MPHISCMVQQAFGALIAYLPCLLMLRLHRMSSRLLLGGHHIPPGLMSMKHTEFMRLTQGTKSLTKYLHAFNNLSRYAPKFVNTDAKKIASFKR